MVKRTGDEFYHQCKKKATRFGFCGTHLGLKRPRVKAPKGVPAYRVAMPSHRLTFALISEARVYRHSWWNTNSERIAQKKCIELHKKCIELHRAITNRPEQPIWACNKCGETFPLLMQMRGKEITRAQGEYLTLLMTIRVITDEEKGVIFRRMETHDRLWAWRAIHELKAHRQAKIVSDELPDQPAF